MDATAIGGSSDFAVQKTSVIILILLESFSW